jgi:hypothetical protein
VGPHRSGTTLLYGLIGQHPRLGYLNNASRRWPASPRLAWALTGIVYRDKPVEAQKFWDRFRPAEDDVMTREHATQEACRFYQGTLRRMLELRSAERLVAKYPRLSLRLRWIDEVFPGAVLVHILRDWRAIVNSSLTRWRRRRATTGEWYGVRIPGWREMGELSPELVAGHRFLYTAKTLEREGPAFGARYLCVRYSELCGRPMETVSRILAHCNLDIPAAFEASVRAREIRSADLKWRTGLDPSAISTIRELDPEFFARHED